MTLVRWNPLREMERWEPFPEMSIIRQQMDRLFEQLLPPDASEAVGLTFVPPAEIAETDTDLKLKIVQSDALLIVRFCSRINQN
jgi:HSP20 family protein